MNEYDEINAKCNDFAIRRAKILVKIREQKLKLARLDYHYAQFMAELAHDRAIDDAQFEANLDALDRARAIDDQLPQPNEEIN